MKTPWDVGKSCSMADAFTFLKPIGYCRSWFPPSVKIGHIGNHQAVVNIVVFPSISPFF